LRPSVRDSMANTLPPRRRRRLLLTAAAAVAVIVVVAAEVAWPRGGPQSPNYPALTVDNGVVISTINLTLPINTTTEFLGDFNVSSEITENVSGNRSLLQLFAEVFAQPVGDPGFVSFSYLLFFSGNLSPGLDPSSVSMIFNNAVNGSAAAEVVELTGVGPGMGVPSNLSGYTESLGDPGFTQWGSNGVSLPLVNQTSAGGLRFHFSFPTEIMANYPRPPSGSTQLNPVQVRGVLNGLGQGIYCQFSALVDTTYDA
jgi:hypothetical protein